MKKKDDVTPLLKFELFERLKAFKFNSQIRKKLIIGEAQIVKAIKGYGGGREHSQICRELGIHKSTFYDGERNIPEWTGRN